MLSRGSSISLRTFPGMENQAIWTEDEKNLLCFPQIADYPDRCLPVGNVNLFNLLKQETQHWRQCLSFSSDTFYPSHYLFLKTQKQLLLIALVASMCIPFSWKWWSWPPSPSSSPASGSFWSQTLLLLLKSRSSRSGAPLPGLGPGKTSAPSFSHLLPGAYGKPGNYL